jgi:hypothetical protein
MVTDEILAELAIPAPHFPAAALRAAQDAGGELAEKLMDVISTTHRGAVEGRLPAGVDYVYAMLLLARLEEPRAHRPIADFFTLPGKTIDLLVGDFLTEDLGRVLASVCGRDLDPLAQIVEDRSRFEWVRVAGVSAIITLVQRGHLSREAASAYFRALWDEKLEAEATEVWGALGGAVLELHLDELFGHLRAAMEDELIDPAAMDVTDLERVVSRGRQAVLDALHRDPHHRPVIDVVAETEGWACFAPEEESDVDAASECDDPHCSDHAHPTPFRRESPKVGRNDPCPCGSGQKFKKCCGR